MLPILKSFWSKWKTNINLSSPFKSFTAWINAVLSWNLKSFLIHTTEIPIILPLFPRTSVKGSSHYPAISSLLSGLYLYHNIIKKQTFPSALSFLSFLGPFSSCLLCVPFASTFLHFIIFFSLILSAFIIICSLFQKKLPTQKILIQNAEGNSYIFYAILTLI